jgi:hypothetical protein
MIRVAASGLVVVLVGIPLVILPSTIVAWIAGASLVAGLVGAIVGSVALVTASVVIALIEYALALVVAQAPVDVATAIGFGVTLFLLLEIAHFAGRVHGAAVGPTVFAGELRAWVMIAAAGAIASGGLVVGGAALRVLVPGGGLPAVVVAGAVGALAAGAGVILLVTERKPLTDDGGIGR